MALPAPSPSIDTCTACGKLFPRLAIRLCSVCALVEENRFALVRDFLLENDGAAVGQIASETGVRAGEVRKFLEGGRLVELGQPTQEPGCTCSGNLGDRCRTCRSRLSHGFRELEQAMRRDHAPSTGRSPHDLDGRTTYVRRVRRLGEQP